MQKFTFDRRTTGLFSDQQNLFTYDQERLLPFIHRTFSIENFEKQVREKKSEFTNDKRKLLVSELRKQYASLTTLSKVSENIDSLENEQTFTITTGHQLSLFTGPVFFIYKILHVIRLCEELSQKYSEYHFVPVFWMASEDHDLEEVRSVDVFGRALTWETEQQGAVGRMTTEGMDVLKSTIRSFFEGKEGADVDRILESYTGKTQSEAMLNLVHSLFGHYGLICLNGDNKELKRSFAPLIKKEITDGFSHQKVEETSRSIEKNGLKVQVKSREVNLFYLKELNREKILNEQDGFYLKDEGVKSLDQTLEMLENDPECFSPNVILRPLYQESILPNLCYVGGVGELSYWIQLKDVFDEANITFPLIQARTSILYLDGNSSKKMDKANLQLEDLFQDKESLKKSKLKEQAADEMDFSTVEQALEIFKNELASKIISVDAGLDKYAESELVKLTKQLDSVKEKLTRSVKQRHEVQLNTIDQLFMKLFPDGVMQERVLNLFSMCPDGKIHHRIAQLHSMIDPFDPDLVVLME
jgi:bacillithiol biosynthesis cysteine-adding enzyme BshC